MNSSKLVHFWRLSFIIIAWIFTICITTQVLMAGLALFTNPMYWNSHTVFARFFFFLPILMAILAYLAQVPKITIWRCFGLFGMVIGLFFTAAISSRFGILAALHPVITIFLFYNCMKVIQTFNYQFQ
ncbi:DUF6220 domain-containing protein [Oceanobacillus jeddahense]|uniref:DUF6220 domain-containing protein n=1 Tax=Oceanobacillus jeddahense TaxID=1462527 RepID=UPI0036420429